MTWLKLPKRHDPPPLQRPLKEMKMATLQKMKTKPPMRKINTESAPHGFFWRTQYTYNCVILHKARKVLEHGRKRSFCEEFAAESPAELIQICENNGYGIGTKTKVEELCNSSALW